MTPFSQKIPRALDALEAGERDSESKGRREVDRERETVSKTESESMKFG